MQARPLGCSFRYRFLAALLISVVSSPSFYTANGGRGMPKDPAKLGNFVAALTLRQSG